MPSDLIYREDAKDYARHAMAKGLNVLEYLDEVPVADFRPVVRGRWQWTVDDDDRLGEYWKCNLCGERSYIGYNFCPNCGADMREEAT